MKHGFYHGQMKGIEAFKPFRSLWKTDDEAWVNARKEAFKQSTYYKDDGSPNAQFLAKFYVYGEEPPGYIGEDKLSGTDIDFDYSKRLAYTPLTNKDEVKAFWNATVLCYGPHAEQRHSAARHFSGWLAGMPEQDDKVKLITSSLFTPEYFMNKVGGDGVSKDDLTTIRPTSFIIDFSGLKTFYHKNNKDKKWDYRSFCFDYFMLCINYCQTAKDVKHSLFTKELERMFEFLLCKDDNQLSEYRLKLKQQVMDAAMAEDAPALLKDALQKAKENLED